MTIVDMLGQSGVLTLLGMGIVFSFLIILIISVTLVGRVIHAIGADKADQRSDVTQNVALAATSGGGAATASAVTAPVIAAITAAVTEYRKTHL